MNMGGGKVGLRSDTGFNLWLYKKTKNPQQHNRKIDSVPCMKEAKPFLSVA